MTAQRRTQAERRQVTRAALLDATVECLAEQGYAGATTRVIAQRAGVTPGALQHHFRSKSELVAATMRHLLGRFAEEMLSAAEAGTPDQDRQGLLLDRMWELHRGPLFEAGLELLVAARTNADLREGLQGALAETANLIASGAPLLYPGMADTPGFTELVMTGQATMRGIALLGFAGEANVESLWAAARTQLLASSAALRASDAGGDGA